MTTMTHISLDDLVELDERESNGIRVTLIWNRTTSRASVLVSDERTGEAFALDVRVGDRSARRLSPPLRLRGVPRTRR